MAKNYIDKLAYILLKEGKVLTTLSKGKDAWYIPGGKREGSETDEQALILEVKEELTVDLLPATIRHYGTFEAQAHGKPEGTVVRMTCYTADFTGTLAASSEIEKFDFFTYDQKAQSSPVDGLIFDDLYLKGHLLSAQPTLIQKVALAVIKDRKLLLVRSSNHKDAYFTLGGKIEQGEQELAALAREIKEEVQSTIKEGTLAFLKEFRGAAHGKQDTLVSIKLYQGELATEPIAASEIAEVSYFDSSIEDKHLTSISKEIFTYLKSTDQID